MRRLNKKGDINLSFGVIFSMILIAVFVFAAIYAINFFLNYSKCIQVGNFYDNLQREISDAYSSSYTANKKVKINLPGDIDKICFANVTRIDGGHELHDELSLYEYEDANLFLIPGKNACQMPYKKLDRLNLSRTIIGNPLCFDNGDEFSLEKGTYDRLVWIK